MKVLRPSNKNTMFLVPAFTVKIVKYFLLYSYLFHNFVSEIDWSENKCWKVLGYHL